MGTSQSSGGPKAGVPMVPTWADTPADVPAGDGDASPSDGDTPSDEPGGAKDDTAQPLPAPAPLAPKTRFSSARSSLASFTRTGQGGDMHRALGHYIRRGYGGSGTAVRRFGGTVATARALHHALSAVAAGGPAGPGSPLDPALLAGRSAREVIDAVIEAVRPVNGTQDAEAGRWAIRDALTELLTRFPEADLLNLTEEQRAFAVERYAAIDVYRRFDLDLGKTIRSKAPSAVTALSRLRQVRDYIKETIAAAFRRLRDAGRSITAGRVAQVVRDALRAAFEVFEGYAK